MPPSGAAPLPDRFVAHGYPLPRQHFLYISEAQSKAVVEPDGMTYDLWGETMIFYREAWYMRACLSYGTRGRCLTIPLII